MFLPPPCGFKKPVFINKQGFTLAEVLITLVIIGVIAAITVPTLITKYQKEQTVTKLKKAYSEINQAIRSAEMTWGTIDTWNFADFNSPQERVDYFTYNYLKPNLKTIKICSPSSNECWADNVKTIDNLDVSEIRNDYAGKNSLITNSGYSLYYWLHASGDGGWFFVDINGHSKGPNRVGRDIFPFVFQWTTGSRSKYGFYPAYMTYQSVIASREDLINGSAELGNTNVVCKKGTNKSKAGYSCTALIAIDNWQIKDDYPW